jgi:predicted ArsR family transcriptional regulator
MKKSLVLGAGRGPRLAVLELIKRSGRGMSVQEIATSLDMSYMGVKAHCLALASTGHLATRREVATKGRPRLLYQLADAGEQLFADTGGDIALGLLHEAAKLYGATAPQKLLLLYFRSLQARYAELISSEPPLDRARSLVRVRDKEGRMAELVIGSPWEIRESHNPLSSIMEEYPEARTLEEQMICEVIGIPVRRREDEGRVTFISTT